MKFIEECVMFIEEHVLVKNLFTNEQKMICYESELKNQPMKWKHIASLLKKKLQQSVEKVMLTVFWNMQGPISIDFLVNSASNYPLLW